MWPVPLATALCAAETLQELVICPVAKGPSLTRGPCSSYGVRLSLETQQYLGTTWSRLVLLALVPVQSPLCSDLGKPPNDQDSSLPGSSRRSQLTGRHTTICQSPSSFRG